MKYIWFVLIFPILFVSCISEDYSECKGEILLSVKDKNYDNVSEIADFIKMDEDRALIDYVSPISIEVNNEKSVGSKTFGLTMRAGDRDVVINQDGLVAGQNEIVAIGNEYIAASNYATATFRRELHSEEEEHSDMYIGADELYLPLYKDHRIWLYRTKGLLLVRFVNLPDAIARVDVTADGVYSTVGKSLDYSGMTQVHKSFDISLSGNALLSLMLAPSVPPGGAHIELTLTDGVNNGITLSNIPVNITRNKITVIQPSYNPDTRKWSLSVLVDGEWRNLENLHIV